MRNAIFIADNKIDGAGYVAPRYSTIPIPRFSFPKRPAVMRSIAMTEVSVVIVCYNGREHLRQCLESVIQSQDGEILRHVVVVDNNSTDDSAEIVTMEFPAVHLVRSECNRGFAGGNNLGWEFINKKFPDTKYVALLNQDTVVESGWLTPLVEHLENHPICAAAQAKIMLLPQKNQINTLGNEAHFLGFGFTTLYGKTDNGQFEGSSHIGFASGAASLIRTDAIRRAGLFDEVFFLYLEDADLGWKLRQLGYQIDVVGTSKVWHKYSFQHDYRFYFYLERNRWYLLATYYKMPTLLMLLPAILAMEIGQFYFAFRKNVLDQKLRAVKFFFDRKNFARVVGQRSKAQRRRLVSDRRFTASFTSKIQFPELKSRILKRIGNPLLSAYWSIARRLLWW